MAAAAATAEKGGREERNRNLIPCWKLSYTNFLG